MKKDPIFLYHSEKLYLAAKRKKGRNKEAKTENA